MIKKGSIGAKTGYLVNKWLICTALLLIFPL